jgi:hypothetical protein
MEPVTIFRAFSPAEAHLVRSELEAAGFTAAVTHELAALSLEGYSMATGGICVVVPADEAEEARECLSARPVADPPPGT